MVTHFIFGLHGKSTFDLGSISPVKITVVKSSGLAPLKKALEIIFMERFHISYGTSSI